MSFEDFLKSLLTVNQNIKLSLLREFKEQNLNVRDLSIKLGVTIEKLIRLIFEMVGELEGEKYEAFKSVTVKNDKVIFSNFISGECYQRANVYLWQKFLWESGLFRALLYILEYRCFRLVELSVALSYSESYTYKLFKRLKNILENRKYGLRILKLKKGYMALEGNESDIRVFHYLTISINSQGDTWFFKRISQDGILSSQIYLDSKKYRELSPIGQKNINNIIGIFKNANRHGFSLSKIDEEIEVIGGIISGDQEAQGYMRQIVGCTDTRTGKKSIELLYLVLFVTYFVQGLRNTKEIELVGDKLSLNKNNSIINLNMELLQSISDVVYLPKALVYSLLYKLTHAYIIMIHIGLHKFLPVISEDDCIQGCDIINEVEKIVQNKLLILKDKVGYQELVLKYVQIISGELIYENSKPLCVYVEFFKCPNYKGILEKALVHSFSAGSLRIVSSYSDADVLISDDISGESIKHFYFESVYDDESWKRLSQFLYALMRKNTLSGKIIQE